MPAAAVNASVTELPESRVRVDVEVPAAELERRMESVARALGREMKLPGFRKGKVPPQVIAKRLGRETVLDETIRQTLGRWYVEALDASTLHVVGDPQLSVDEAPEAGKPLTFHFEIGVRPTAQLGTYKGLEVARRTPGAEPDAVDAQVDELRTRMSKLETVEQAAASGDFVVMDYLGRLGDEQFEGGAGTDQLIELGSGRLVPGFEEQLEGASAGDERTVELTFPEDYQAEHLAGQDASFAVTIKEVRSRILPELDDQFASDAAGFDTLDELREDIATRIAEMDAQRADGEFREAVLDAVVAHATVEVPDALVDARGRELLDRMLHQLEHQGINREMYFQISGRTEEEMLAESAGDAAQTLRREAVLAAIVEAEQIEPTDGDVLDALQESAAREGAEPEKLRAELEKAGRLDDLREDLANRAALDLIVEHATALEDSAAAEAATAGEPAPQAAE